MVAVGADVIPIPGKAQLIAAAVAALAVAVLLAWGLYWRGEAREAAVKITALAAQGAVLAEATRACNAGVEAARASSAEAIQRGAQLLAEAKRIGQPARAQAARIEALLAKGTPAGADCRDAWRAIEADRKAGAAP